MKRLAALALFCGALSLSPGAAQDPPKVQRTHYAVRNADPVVLAEVVGAHFKGDATLIAAPAGSGNAVLVSGPPAAVTEVVRLLEQLDRRPRGVEVEVAIAELPAPADGKEFTAADVARVDGLVKDGKGQRIRLAAVEGQQATTQVGGDKPYVTGSVPGPRGVAQKSVSYRPTGTTVKLTPRVGAENAVGLDLSVQESKVRAAEEEGGAPAFENSTLTTKLTIPAGKSVIAQAVRAEGKAGPTVTVVVVTARVVDEQPKAGGR